MVHKTLVRLALALGVLVCPSLALAQSSAPALIATKLAPEAEEPVIDGRVGAAEWQSATPFSTFTQQDPNEGAPATERTEVRIIVGKGTVFVGIVCFDSDPSKIIVSQARRDASLNETDSIIMVLDTFNDSQNAFVFGTTDASGYQPSDFG